jgi:L-alanine-DL-glutamate epimerase-like enolase superfamily enzyme
MTGTHVISSVRTGLLRLPLKGALRWGAASEMRELEHVLVMVETESGLRGLAEAPVRPTIYGETVASIREATLRLLGPRLIGRELGEAALTGELAALPFNHAARGALDTALYAARANANARSFREEVAAIDRRAGSRGGQAGARREVEVSYILGMDSPDGMVQEAERVVGAGVRVLKVKVGRDAKSDRAVLGALSHAFSGEGVTLYADANQAYRPEVVLERLSALARAGLAFVEEPLPVHLTRRRAELRRASPLPIIADDSCFGPDELERELDFDTFDILNVKPARTGVSRSVTMLRAAADAGKGVMVGSQASSGLGTLHAAALALRPEVDHPCELAFPLRLQRDSLAGPLSYRSGRLSADEIEQATPAPFLNGLLEPGA